MGFSPIGSNNKARTTLVFGREIERQEFKGAISDIAEVRNTSPSDTVLSLVFENVATTTQARDIAKTLYASTTPRCQVGYELVFQDLAAVGENGRDAKPVVEGFLKLVLDLGLQISTIDKDAHHLRNQWDSITYLLSEASKTGDVATVLAVRTARQLGSALEAPSPGLAFPVFVSTLLDNWDAVRSQSCTYRVLCDFARMAFPTRRGKEETAETRLTFLKTADAFYSNGREADSENN